NPVETKALVEAILQRAGGYYAFAAKEKNNEREADYELHLRNGDVIITRPDDEFRPLVRPMPLVEEEHIDPIVSVLIHIAQWHFIKELKNTNEQSALAADIIEIKVTQKSTTASKKLTAVNNSVPITYSKEDNAYKTFINVELKNKSDKELYVAALYLDKNFMSYPGILSPNPHLLGPKKTVQLQLRQSNDLELRLGEQEQEYNWPVVTEYFKIIASEVDFDVDSLNLSPLPAPYILSDQGKDKGAVRGLVVEADDTSITVKKWHTQILELVAKNPLFNTIPKDKLEGLLNYEETAQFAAGIYYDVTLDDDGQPRTLTLKKGIKLPEGERGILGDVKLWAANLVETLVRRKMYNSLRKNPSRMRIVAEGDSWFQYPILLRDTLDQLYKLYAIKSYAEAGDTMENYMKKREYLKGIREENPKFFLISGGGNDILGKQFKDFLKYPPAAGDNTPRRFLNDKFDAKLKDLKKWYSEMLKELLDEFPDLQIITQSYDYAIPVDTNASPKTTSWLGRYMIDKGMDNQQDREDVIRYMVDKFNDCLKEVSEPYPDNVSYVNVRGLIQRDGWFDEIHPKDDGFQSIADRFVEIIEAKKKKVETKNGGVKSAKPEKPIGRNRRTVFVETEMEEGGEDDEPEMVPPPIEIPENAEEQMMPETIEHAPALELRKPVMKNGGGGTHHVKANGKKSSAKKSMSKKWRQSC
ncbi:MAG TPA: SGNH/GDSL hydrolase family protein, partial [Saprospiraceae bacterium]|nr:SGNH/GDSL hydrolase family protein [Saprospiraceae bacterium]